MGILRVRNLISPPYVYSHPFTTSHRVAEDDLFVVLGSDGLFDHFSNDDVVQLAHRFVQDHPFGDPAKFLIEQLVSKVAETSGTILSLPTKFNLQMRAVKEMGFFGGIHLLRPAMWHKNQWRPSLLMSDF